MTETNKVTFPTPEEIEAHMAEARRIRAVAFRDFFRSMWSWRPAKAEKDDKSFARTRLAKQSGAAA